jgi:hypothetical protein
MLLTYKLRNLYNLNKSLIQIRTHWNGNSSDINKIPNHKFIQTNFNYV